MDFRQILREKISERQAPQGVINPSTTFDTEPLHLSFLLGTIQNPRPFPPKNKNYFVSPAPKPGSRASSNAPTATDRQQELPQIPSAPEHLPPQQQEGWMWFWKKGAPLNERFTSIDLQKQFRKLAKALHPDQNPHPRATECFLQLRDHYESLNDYCIGR